MTARALAAAVCACALTSADVAVAQSAAPPPPSAEPAAASAAHKVAANSLITIEIAEPISTRVQKRGDMFAIRLSRPIMLDGEVLVPAGVTGQGQVVDAGRAGMGGKPAKLVLATRFLDWNGQRLPLHGFKWARGGEDRQDEAGALLMMPYVGVLSIFVHGGEIDIPAGTNAMAKLGADIAAPAAVSPAPAAQPVPSPQPAVQGSAQ